MEPANCSRIGAGSTRTSCRKISPPVCGGAQSSCAAHGADSKTMCSHRPQHNNKLTHASPARCFQPDPFSYLIISSYRHIDILTLLHLAYSASQNRPRGVSENQRARRETRASQSDSRQINPKTTKKKIQDKHKKSERIKLISLL